MGRILLFGSVNLNAIPADIIDWLVTYNSQGHEFIMASHRGADSAFHKTLSSIGALDRSTIYCMDKPTNNRYDLKCKVFKTFYNEEDKRADIVLMQGLDSEEIDESFEPLTLLHIENQIDIQNNKQYIEFVDRQLIKDCDIAIGLWDNDNNRVSNMINLLNIYGKPCYTFNVVGE